MNVRTINECVCENVFPVDFVSPSFTLLTSAIYKTKQQTDKNVEVIAGRRTPPPPSYFYIFIFLQKQ